MDAEVNRSDSSKRASFSRNVKDLFAPKNHTFPENNYKQNQAWKSEQRLFLEKEIVDSLEEAQKEVFKWCLMHPIKGVRAILSLSGNLEIPESTTKAWFELPSRKKYIEAYRSLDLLEKKEEFQGTARYIQQLNRIKDKLPNAAKKKGYYVCAGLDFYWSKVFDSITFEDSSYGQTFTQNMWWSPKDYSKEKVESVIEDLRDRNAVLERQKISLINRDSHSCYLEDSLPALDTTLIIKGGHSIKGFFSDRFNKNSPQYGAIVIVSPHEKIDELLPILENFGYVLDYIENEEPFFVPYSMSSYPCYIFSKEN